MKKILMLFVILFAIIIAAGATNRFSKLPSLPFFKTPKITIGKTEFKLLAAKDTRDKEIGLSKTPKLNNDTGMIFIFGKPGFYPFWMKDMKFPIDIIFINKDKIVTIIQNASAPKEKNETLQIFNSSSPADSVLEINTGLSQKNNFKEGDSVKIEL